MKNKVFLDTSVIITATLSSNGGSHYILTNLVDRCDFYINKYALQEAEDVIERKFSHRKDLYPQLFLLLSLAEVNVVNNPPREKIEKLFAITKKKDTPILASALEYTDFLLTLDQKDLLQDEVIKYASKNDLKILKPGDFIEKLS